MGGSFKLPIVALICGCCAPAVFSQTTAPAPVAPTAPMTASRLLDLRMSAERKVRAGAAKHFLSQQIGEDLVNADESVQSSAVVVLNKLLKEDLRDPGGQPIIPDKSAWCGRVLAQPGAVDALVNLGQYSLIEQLAAEAIANGSDLPFGDFGQAALVKLYLARGRYDLALSAAKAYYNYCLLENTPNCHATGSPSTGQRQGQDPAGSLHPAAVGGSPADGCRPGTRAV